MLEAELERFVEVASGEFGAERVILFGSLARALEGNEKALGDWSDLDLVIVAETGEPFYERIKRLLRRVRPRVQSRRRCSRLHPRRVGAYEFRAALREEGDGREG